MYAQTADTVYIWPEQVPGETEEKHPPVVTPDHSNEITRLIDVTNPAYVVYKPDAGNDLGKGIIINPGGGYQILAINLEGEEIARWLNSLGYTAFVLQYRVPDKKEGALQDLQRTIRLVRSKSKEYQIDPNMLGVLGFSAGGSLSARASTLYDVEYYDAVDETDSLSSRPDFSVLIYPAYLDEGENRSITPELKVTADTPPMFIFGTADDPYGNSPLVMAGALRDNKVPVELHFLATGGHGYGLRKGNIAGETWPVLAEKWLKNITESKASNGR